MKQKNNINKKYIGNPALGNFVRWVRRQKNGSVKPPLAINKVQELEALGFEWERKKIKPWFISNFNFKNKN